MSKTVMAPHAGLSLEQLAEASRKIVQDLGGDDDWMSRANAESAAALSVLASEAALLFPNEPAAQSTYGSKNQPTIEDLKAPLLAAVGAADLALATVNEIAASLRERAEEASTRVEERRAALAKLQEDLPQRAEELRSKLTAEELRKAAEGYVEAATANYNSLVERGEAALERLRSQPGFKEAAARAEGYVDQAVELTQEALGNVSSQTRAVGERATKLVGVELPNKAEGAAAPVKKAAAKAPAKKAAAKKAPAKKAPAKRTVRK